MVDSWAEYLYRELGVLKGFDPNIRTLDIDFLVRNLRKPSEPLGLAAAAREAGYFVEPDRLTGATKIMDRSGLEIEFLIGKRGAGAESALKTNSRRDRAGGGYAVELAPFLHGHAVGC